MTKTKETVSEDAVDMRDLYPHEVDGACMCPNCRWHAANQAKVRSTPIESLLERISALEALLKEKN